MPFQPPGSGERGHKSVLLAETIRWLGVRESSWIADGTLGLGGHAAAIAGCLGAGGRLIGLDRDPEAVQAAAERLRRYGDRIMILHEDFKEMAGCFAKAGISAVDGILLDLGVSSRQLDSPTRGFSFLKDSPLDMRMNPADALSAETVVNTFSERELSEIFWRFGEERYARRIAQRIVRARAVRRVRTTRELADIVFQAVPKAYRYGRIHPATRTFQAVRIKVNDELGSLGVFLSKAMPLLKPQGRLVIISFHSLEDRMVKQCFRSFEKEGLGKVLTKKPVMAGADEVGENPRARSAKLRVFEKNS